MFLFILQVNFDEASSNLTDLGGISNYLKQSQVILSSGFPTQELDL